ncbi:MAG: cardiolipin synthase ClsB [Nitrospirae bacterium]|nr:cardiolipin synthase ClsB [Nitrospirota bacterium]
MPEVTPPSAEPPDDDEGLRLCLRRDRLHEGNTVQLLRNGSEAFPAMLRAIEDARRTIALEAYMFRSDRTGTRFADALATKAGQGLVVVLIYDAVGSRGADPALFDRLRHSGVRILEYHPIAPWRRGWGWWRRDHRKLLVVDGRVGFTGGINICDDHLDAAEGGGGWRDTHLRVEGPAVHDLQKLFLSTWRDERGPQLDERSFLPALDPSAGRARAGALGSRRYRSRRAIRWAYVHAIKHARGSIAISNAYFVPDRGILRALINAAWRGVAVRILLTGASDVPTVRYAGRARYSRLLSTGIRLFEWQGSILHAKTAVIDGMWSSVGSYNMDHRSVFHNLELNVTVLDRDFGADVERMFEADLENSREITAKEWKKRPPHIKALESVLYAFRHWL